MSTETETETETIPEERAKQCSNSCIIIIFSVLVILAPTITLIATTSTDSKPRSYTELSISVESTEVNAFNLTTDNHLLWSMNMEIRAHNHNQYRSMDLYGMNIEVKNKDERLISDKFGDFSLRPDCQSLIDVEVKDDGHVELNGNIADELRHDVSVGEGHVDVLMNGFLFEGRFTYPVYVNCGNVAVDFTRSTKKLQKVDCQITLG